MSDRKEDVVKFLITVKTLQNNFLTYPISGYEIESGAIIRFTDRKTGEIKRFPTSSVEIKEVKE